MSTVSGEKTDVYELTTLSKTNAAANLTRIVSDLSQRLQGAF